MSGLKSVLIFLLLFSVAAAEAGTKMTQCPAVQPEKNPFWRKKEKVAVRIKEDRFIAVSVKTRKPKMVLDKKTELYLLGSGLVEAPMEFAYARAQEFEDYPKMSGMIKSSKYDAANQILEMVMEAFKYRARLKMKIDMPPGSDSYKDIRFCVLEGSFTHMGGVIRLEKSENGRSQISLTALQGFDKLPLPKFFLEFGIEVAMQIAAGRMRGFVEEAYQHEKTSAQKKEKTN